MTTSYTNRIKELYDSGVPLSAIAKELKISNKSLGEKVKAMGLPNRKEVLEKIKLEVVDFLFRTGCTYKAAGVEFNLHPETISKIWNEHIIKVEENLKNASEKGKDVN